jgi:hypothetical protein
MKRLKRLRRPFHYVTSTEEGGPGGRRKGLYRGANRQEPSRRARRCTSGLSLYCQAVCACAHTRMSVFPWHEPYMQTENFVSKSLDFRPRPCARVRGSKDQSTRGAIVIPAEVCVYGPLSIPAQCAVCGVCVLGMGASYPLQRLL